MKNISILHTSTAESPCTISVEPKDGGYKYSSGYISLKIYQYQGEKTPYGSPADYADTLREYTSIYPDENGYGSTEVTFPDDRYNIHFKIDHVAICRYKE